jgi:tRNA-Thr(GGU) m(6)t(6)A37 methyltransferase TsaA
MTDSYLIRPIGVVRSALRTREEAPRQGGEGAPEAWLEIDPAYADALDGVEVGSEIIVLAWFHQADRGVLKVHPMGDAGMRLTGVFATRSPDRPNPIGLHRVRVRGIESGCRLLVHPLEAIDGTPIADLKCVLDPSREE